MSATPDIVLAPHTHAYCYVWASESIERELSEELSFLVPGSQYMSKFRKGWDGKVRLLNRTTKMVYAGLASRIERWARKQNYTIENRLPPAVSAWDGFDTERLLQTYPTALEVRDYQRDAITYGLHHSRAVLLSPTASGKSLVLYYLVRARMMDGPVLLVVPTITLVKQMVEDWRGYGWTDVDTFVHQITGGVKKETQKPVVVSTWQSIFRQPEEWFSRYRTLLGDEAHTFKAESLRSIMEKLPHCAHRIGVTGTLDDAKSNKLMVEGVFGAPHRVARTADLQERGHLTPIRIQGHFLQYPSHDRWLLREQHRTYAEEMTYLAQHPARMDWLVQFASQLRGNVLILFHLVEKHGVPLYRAMRERLGTSRPIYFISGEVAAESREQIRALLEHPEHIILTFDDQQIRCIPTELIPLMDGRTVPASEITPNDDVENGWILNRISKEMLKPVSIDNSTSKGYHHVTMGKDR